MYSLGEQIQATLAQFSQLIYAQPLWAALLLLAVLPAVCEELTFRGFIFGGLVKQGGALRAILITSLFFGFTHTVLQQSIAATIMGLMLGVIAWRTGGVICCICVHVINNVLSIALSWFPANHYDVPPALSMYLRVESDAWMYQPQWQTISTGIALVMIVILFQRSREPSASCKSKRCKQTRKPPLFAPCPEICTGRVNSSGPGRRLLLLTSCRRTKVRLHRLEAHAAAGHRE